MADDRLITADTPLEVLKDCRASQAQRSGIFPDARTALEALDEVIRLRGRGTEIFAGDYKRVTLCGSARFAEAYQTWHARLMVDEAAMVFTAPNLAAYDELPDQAKADIDLIWFAMIEISHEVFVLDVDGYIGDSTAEEIAFAKERGVPVRFLSEEELGDG